MRLRPVKSARRRLLAVVLFRPWFDKVAVRAIADWYFPLSRAWAAGRAAAGDLAAFCAALPDCRPSPTLARGLARLAALDRDYAATAAAWEESFFGAGARDLAAAERERRESAMRLMAARGLFLGVRLRGGAPPVRWEIAPPAQVEQAHGPRLASGACAFPPHSGLRIEASRAFSRGRQREYWLRLPSPHLGGWAWAHVREPVGRPDAPTFICHHGIGVEAEFWGDPHDALNDAVEAGVRVVRPEGPWHGRRALAGFFGGEPILARAPLAILDYFQAAVAETAALVGWARATSRGRVAVGGVSLGALVSECVACAACDWPGPLAPDALLLIAPGGSFLRIVMRSALTRRLGLPERLARAGWDETALARFLPLAEPRGAPAVDPARILAVLGAADEVTPFADARALVSAWGVPPGNLFTAPKGHFSVSLDAGGLERPLARLADLLH